MDNSILNNTKLLLGLGPDDPSFDGVVMMHTNSVFSILHQLGIGPPDGFMITDATTTWDAFLGPDTQMMSVKTYVYLRVRLLFDPPGTSFAIEAMDRQIAELEWRLNVQREAGAWTDPTLAVP